jgi:hypothetical protein
MKNRYLINPTVLLVEDHVQTLRKNARDFTLNTALGVLPVTNLRDASKYLTKQNITRYHLSSVFADQEFAPEAQTEDLHNGLDLLEFVNAKKLHMGLYLNTVHADDDQVLKRAKETIGSTSRVFPKGQKREASQQPWNCIWRDWLLEALKTEPEIQDILEHDKMDALEARERYLTGEVEIAERLRKLFDAHRITYLFTMGPVGSKNGLLFRNPIEVVCVRDLDGLYSARALGLGVLRETNKVNDAWTAQMDLADIIVEEYLDLKSTSKEQLGKFGARVWSNLSDSIEEELVR